MQPLPLVHTRLARCGLCWSLPHPLAHCSRGGPQIGLTKIYGIGHFQAKAFCARMGINPFTKVAEIETDMPLIRDMVERTFPPKPDLQKAVGANIIHKIKIGSYEGLRHTQGLPVRGQRSRTNAATQKRLAAA